jgi:hypothetical protein
MKIQEFIAEALSARADRADRSGLCVPAITSYAADLVVALMERNKINPLTIRDVLECVQDFEDEVERFLTDKIDNICVNRVVEKEAEEEYYKGFAKKEKPEKVGLSDLEFRRMALHRLGILLPEEKPEKVGLSDLEFRRMALHRLGILLPEEKPEKVEFEVFSDDVIKEAKNWVFYNKEVRDSPSTHDYYIELVHSRVEVLLGREVDIRDIKQAVERYIR